jgi:hypothetical protein
MAQRFDEVRIPFAKMTFTPDVPSTALGPNEYNSGQNVETDVRGIRSMAGDESILTTVPGTPTFVTGGFRQGGEFWFIVATTEGYWWASNGVIDWYNITPGGGPIVGYAQNTNITEAWNGTIAFFNDTVGAPMFLPDAPGAILAQYSNLITPAGISSMTVGVTTVTAVFDSAYDTTPYIAGQQIVVTGVSTYFDGTYPVVSCTTTQVEYASVPGAAVPGDLSNGQISPAYTWNYNPNYKSYYANFMRLYSTPNVGSILVAGNLTTIDVNGSTITGNTVSGNATVITSAATTNMINAAVTGNGIPANATVSDVSAGVNLTLNVPATATNTGTSLTVNLATELPVTVQWSQAFGLNQAPDTWAPTITNVANQLEVPLRGAALDAFPAAGNFFLCSYWDTVVFSPINYSTTSAPILGVRLFNQGRGLLSSNCWANTDKLVYGVDARDIWVFDGQEFTGIGNQRVKNWFYDQLAPEYYDRVFMEVNNQRNQIEIYYPNSDAIGGVPNQMISYRYDIDCWNAPRDVTSATFACESPVWSYDTAWTPALASRTVVYARGQANVALVQKDQGFSFLSSNANPAGNIASSFRRDNIKLLKDYSGKLLVHRILPEVVNLNNNELPIDPAVDTALKGNITITIEGANSVGSEPTAITPVTIPIDANGDINTKNPWAQINQNAFRVNTIELTNTSNNSIWMASATTWQYTQTEDDR